MSKKLTPWFDGSVKPVRKGVYERVSTPYTGWMIEGTCWSLWDGKGWITSTDNAKSAAKEWGDSSEQCTQWRGLAEQPK